MSEETRKVALVTGASRGIGRATALEFARHGMQLCLAARSREQLEETRRLTGLALRDCLLILIDLAEEEGPQALIEAALQCFKRIDVLVNNAGWGPPRSPLTSMSDKDQDRIIAINLRAPIALTRLAARSMVERNGGAIINIASISARLAPAGEAIYAATKAGLIAFSRACFTELREHGVKVCVISPGTVDTDLIPENKRLDRPRMLTPSDVAFAVMHVIDTPPGVCPVEVVLQPQYNPVRGRR